MANNQHQALINERRVYIQSVILAGKTRRDGLNNWYRYAVDNPMPSNSDTHR
jgi:hypothetical protein